MLWYYSRGLYEDGEFLQLLQEKLDLVQTFMEWEFALLGLVSEDAFTRLAASGLPLAVLPRRESTCSHTINQDPSTVFMLPNMASDWRFKGSPPVAQGGLRSYAGVQLRCQTPTGEYVALGSLCVASNSEHAPLTPTQEGALVRFADMLVTEIVSHSRHERRRQRNILARRLAECRLDDLENAETSLLDLIRDVYPATCINIYKASDNTIPLPSHRPIDIASVQDGLWEDTEVIEELIRTANFTKISTSRTVRAIIHPCQSHHQQKFLVVASSDVQTVFDDVDSWFVEKCAISLANIAQEGTLREAVRAKDKFLRGITHQLRTPIHGVLASCELLTEELAARNSLAGGADASATSPSSIIDTIRDSGKELMTTVNNILKLNRWAETIAARQHVGLQSLAHLEDDIMHEMKQVASRHDLSRIPILFENRLVSDGYITIMDPSLLKECIQSLILNALSNSNDGAVIIVIAAPPDNSRLTFDILDAGCGIAPADQGRIFEAFEKIDLHKACQALDLDLRKMSELEIATPPTPPPEADPVALLVDDNAVNLRILKMYCEKRNITYSTAINGQEAFEQFRKSLEEGRPINLVLMDLQMPVCDGIEATRQIRDVEGRKKPALLPSRILMITGQDSVEDKARSFAAGADAFYVKPMGVKALDQAIGEHFQGFAMKIAPRNPHTGK
ncbi:putative histidine kinase hhk3p [Diaporthe ampelina]|uniref:histidine kinase n=1 Tax=Diaporthe ampelina TaxID=1214573 RepID=A0A0G2FES1_9PEZI|nr:putative histidine kinase hhk3p [Diaporthe ampelina]